MRRLAALVATSLFFACAGDPTVDDVATIVGRVTDNTGTPLAMAHISTMPPTEMIVTSTTGSYSIAKNVKRGNIYQLLAAREGFSDQTDTLTAAKGENRVDFMLQPILICVTGDARCVRGGGAETIEHCDATKTKYEATDCPNGQVCDDSAGMTSAVCTPEERLSVNQVGSGSGIVVSTPAGLSCEPTCMRSFPRGRMVTLTATPYALSAFMGFSGDCTSSEVNCTVTLDASKTVTARFDTSGYLLTINRMGRGRVTSTPAGVNCGAICSAAFPQDTMITLTADPDPGAAFGGWGGACASAGMNLTCMLTLDQNRDVDVRFQTPQFALAVTTAGTGAGTVVSQPAGIDCGADCSESYDVSSIVMLTATSMAGSNFIGWTGDCTGTADCTVTLDQDRNVTATFDGIAHNVTVVKAGGGTGTVVSAPSGINCGATCSASFGEGQMLDLTAMPTNGSLFIGWTDACATAMANMTCTVNVAGDLTATATFEPFYFGPFTPDASCQLLIHFDNPTPFAQACGGGGPAVVTGTYAAIMSRTPLLMTAVSAGGVDEEGHVDLIKLGPVPGLATIEMTVRKTGAAFGARTYGVLYSNEDALDPTTHGVRLLVRDDGRFAAETRSVTGSNTLAESPANAIQDNQWHHLAATLSSTTGIALFVDGARVATGAGPLGWSASSSTAWAGAEREGAAGSIYRFNGAIDEIRVSDVLRY